MYMKPTHYAIALLATLTLIGGCKSATDVTESYADAKSIDNPEQLSDAEKLAIATTEGNKQAATLAETESAQISSQPSKSRAIEPQSCPYGGTMEMSIPDPEPYPDTDFTDISYTDTFTVSLHNCATEEGVEENGTMYFVTDMRDDSGTVTFVTDYYFRSKTENVFVKEGSKFAFHTLEDGWEELVINADMTYNGIRHVGKDLIYRGKELDNETFAQYPVSGKEQIGESALFEVDPNYDASRTPFTSDAHDNITGGLSRYIDPQNRSVEIEVVATNIIAVKVDENSNGTFEAEEISTIKLP